MSDDILRYDLMIEEALRDVVRETLTSVAQNGLPGEHHFYITFLTNFPGVEIPDYLRKQYADEMTIVLQYQFFGMKLAQQSQTIHILSVGESFFGIEGKPGPAALDHYDFGLQGWDAKAMRAKVAAHGLSITPGSRGDDESFKFNDPDGFVVQVNGPK